MKSLSLGVETSSGTSLPTRGAWIDKLLAQAAYCRHFAFDVVLGVAKLQHSTAELLRWREENEKGCSIDGRIAMEKVGGIIVTDSFRYAVYWYELNGKQYKM